MLEVRELTKYYNRRAVVEAVSFGIRPGEIVGYLGPNGAGKSTTVKMLVGLIGPSRGEILFEDRRIGKQPIEYKMRLGYVPEEAILYSHLSGREYLQLAGRLRSIPEKQLTRKVDELLHLFSLDPHKHLSISSYSKGMKLRLELPAAQVPHPALSEERSLFSRQAPPD